MDVLIQGTLSLLYMGSYSDWYMYIVHVYNGNRTKSSPIQAVIIQVINKIGWLHCEGIHCTFSLKKTQQLNGQNVRQQHAHATPSVHLHRHGVLTALLHCPISAQTELENSRIFL